MNPKDLVGSIGINELPDLLVWLTSILFSGFLLVFVHWPELFMLLDFAKLATLAMSISGMMFIVFFALSSINLQTNYKAAVKLGEGRARTLPVEEVAANIKRNSTHIAAMCVVSSAFASMAFGLLFTRTMWSFAAACLLWLMFMMVVQGISDKKLADAEAAGPPDSQASPVGANTSPHPPSPAPD